MRVRFFNYLLLLVAVALTPLLATAETDSTAKYTPDATFTLRTAVADGRLVYIGEGGTIDGKINPTLHVPLGAMVQINMINGDGAMHDVVAPDFNNAKSDQGVGVTGTGWQCLATAGISAEGKRTFR